jgi:hypothetical protein
MSIENDLERGQRAQAVLNNPAFTDAFEMVKQAIVEAWSVAPIRDREGQHELKLQLKLLGDVRANLERALADGKMAAESLKRLNAPQSPAQWRQKVMSGN